MAKAPNPLDAFAQESPSKPGKPSYLDTDLTDEEREVLLTAKAGHADAMRYLHKAGHTRVTQNMVGVWRLKNGWTQT